MYLMFGFFIELFLYYVISLFIYVFRYLFLCLFLYTCLSSLFMSGCVCFVFVCVRSFFFSLVRYVFPDFCI